MGFALSKAYWTRIALMLTEVAAASRSQVIAALHQASAATGSDFQFLLGTAMRESGLKSEAKSSASSASGLFQFVEQTWLGLVKQSGAKYGLGSYSDAISQDGNGHYAVASSSDRQAILALRNDPRIAALMEGEYVKQARNTLEGALGRSVCSGELYAAHFLGPASACRLIRMNQAQPEANAASAFPQAAGANHSVFYHADGSAKSVREVYDWALKQTNLSPASAEATEPVFASSSQRMTPNSNDSSWIAGELLASTGPLVLAGLPQAPFVVTPGVIDLLGTLGSGRDLGQPSN
jgi:hypothetical protein